MSICHICSSQSIETFMSFGKMPVANGFLSPEEFDAEYFFELKVGFCEKCKMVQLTELIDRERMFHDHYAFYSSTSSRMASHFKSFADTVSKKYLKGDDPFVVEIGSNDGILLQNFAMAGIRHLGVEPSKNVAQVAMDKGITMITEFFDKEIAQNIIDRYGKSDAILAANVMCHIPNLHSVVAGIKVLLKPAGVLVFEDPYLGDIVENISYDQIYDEHAFYFSLASISYLFEQHGLEVIDVVPQNVHGGSMRYIIAHKGAQKVSESVNKQIKKEKEIGLNLFGTFEQLRQNIEMSRDQLVNLLSDLRSLRKRIVGYGATSKSTTVTNYCGISQDLLEFISDTTPIKQGKFSPGAHIPVRKYHEFADNYPDYALLFAWNHTKEIMAKERQFMESGGKWIIYVPKVQVLK